MLLPSIPSAILASSLWATFTAAADKTAADYFVKDLPGAPDGPLLKMHAGHIEVVPEHHGNLFFWHFQNRHIGDKQRTVIWVNGGPGCSSMDGAMMEIGPYRVREGGKLEYNNGSWDEFANVLFVDNPVGTGFSYVDTNAYIHELSEMADEFGTFLEKFFNLFPEYENDDLYIAGESYAGQYIPYLAQMILDHNANKNTNWNLKGLLIGNGWISPVDQYPSYLQFAYEQKLLDPGSDAAKTIESQQAICMKKLQGDEKKAIDIPECEDILQDILRLTLDNKAPANQRCVNMYDVRLRDSYSSCGMSWPPDLATVTPYLRQKDVAKALHLDENHQNGWVECSGSVSSAFTARNSIPSIDLLPSILSRVPVILFSGDMDLICNHIGTENLIHRMSWNGGTGFETAPGVWAPKQEWVFEGEAAGYWQQARNLSYVVFYNASHMVPFDYSRRTRDMLDRFMGVDISSIGGSPQSSLIEGEKTIETSVGGHPNSTAAQQSQDEKLKEAEWHAYYRAGQVALVVVLIAAAAWGYFVLRARRRMRGYAGVAGADDRDDDSGLGGGVSGMLRQAPGYEAAFRKSRERVSRDLEASDFDIGMSELGKEKGRRRAKDSDSDEFGLGDDSDSDHGHGGSAANGGPLR